MVEVQPPNPPAAEPVPAPKPLPVPQPVVDDPVAEPIVIALPEADLNWFDEPEMAWQAIVPASIEPSSEIATEELQDSEQLPAIKPIRQTDSRNFDWRPMGQFAIAFSGVLAAAGAAVTVRRRVVRRRFSPRLV